MSIASFNNVRMLAQSVVVPSKEINIYDEVQYYNNDVKRVDRMRKMVGFYKRRVSEKPMACAYYGIAAAERIFNETDISRDSIDALIYMTQKPDTNNPSPCFFVHNKLKLSEKCVAFTVNHGCTAWAYGMYLASNLIQSGAHKRILLIASDMPSIGISPENRTRAPLFGDAGSATVLEYDPTAQQMCFNIETYSDGYEAIISPFSGTMASFNQDDPSDRAEFDKLRDTYILTESGYNAPLLGCFMDGIAVFDFTIRCVPRNIKALMEFASVSESDIDWLCLHQANKQIIQSVGAESDFPLDKVPYYAFENYGNNTMCSIPTTLNTVVRDDQKQSKTLLCSGYGNGLSVVSFIMHIDDKTKLLGVSDWVKPDWFMTRDQYIDYWTNKIKNTKH